MKTVGELDDKDANILAGSDEEFEQVIGGLGEILIEILHVATGAAELGDAIY